MISDRKRLKKGLKPAQLEEDDLDDLSQDSEDRNFIVDDDEVFEEEEEIVRKSRKKKKKKRKKKDSRADELDEDDLDLIQESYPQARKKLKRSKAIDDYLEDSFLGRTEDYLGVASAYEFQQQEVEERPVVKRQKTEHKKRPEVSSQALQSQKSEVASDCNVVPADAITSENIPERLANKFRGRPTMNQESLKLEASWIFQQISSSKLNIPLCKLSVIKESIVKVLVMFNKQSLDVPYIAHFKLTELEFLNEDLLWEVYRLDNEYNRFLEKRAAIAKKLHTLRIYASDCESIEEMPTFISTEVVDQHLNTLNMATNEKELSDFIPLTKFFLEYYLEEDMMSRAAFNEAKQPKMNSFVHQCRVKEIDKLASRLFMTGSKLSVNFTDSRQSRGPPPLSDIPKAIVDFHENRGDSKDTIIKMLKTFISFDLKTQPEVRRGLKQFVIQNYNAISILTEKGRRDFEIFHPMFNIKYYDQPVREIVGDKKLIEFMKACQAEEEGLIKISFKLVEVTKREEKILLENPFFLKMWKFWAPPNLEDQDYISFGQSIYKLFVESEMEGPFKQVPLLEEIFIQIKSELKKEGELIVINEAILKFNELAFLSPFTLTDGRGFAYLRDQQKFEDNIPQKQRLRVMGVALTAYPNRKWVVTTAVVDGQGILIEHRDFQFLLFWRKHAPKDNAKQTELDDWDRHVQDKLAFCKVILDHRVDLISVVTDSLDAKKLKTDISDIISKKFRNNEAPNEADGANVLQHEPIVIYGRPDVPTLFAESKTGFSLLPNCPPHLKKAIGMARFEQDPLNEITNLWAANLKENLVLKLNLHPLQGVVNQFGLQYALEVAIVRLINLIGVDLNALIENEHLRNQLQFVSGFGHRKASYLFSSLQASNDIVTDRNELKQYLGTKVCRSSLPFLKVRVPLDKREINFKCQLQNQYKICESFYPHVELLVKEFVKNKPGIADPHRLPALIDKTTLSEKFGIVLRNLDQFKEWATSSTYSRKMEPEDFAKFSLIKAELMEPFSDFRNKEGLRTIDDTRFSSDEVFRAIIDDPWSMFRVGIIVEGTIIRILPFEEFSSARIIVRLQNGLEGQVLARDTEHFKAGIGNQLQQGIILSGRVIEIRPIDKEFSLVLKCQNEHLFSHRKYLDSLGVTLDQNLIRKDLKNDTLIREEENRKNFIEIKLDRTLNHECFKQVSFREAIKHLKYLSDGQFIIRPSVYGKDHFTVSWRQYRDSVVHIDIEEKDKGQGDEVGRVIKMGKYQFHSFSQLQTQYIEPCNKMIETVVHHPKFLEEKVFDSVLGKMKNEKIAVPTSIPYYLLMLHEYPNYILLVYLPNERAVKEFIRPTMEGLRLHDQYFNTIQPLLQWFKKNYNTPEYQRFLRRAQIPHTTYDQAKEVMNQRERRLQAEGDRILDREEASGGQRGFKQDGPGPNSGDGAGVNKTCFSCGQGGHLSRACPQKQDRPLGRSPMKCYNCQQEGHMSKNCPDNSGGAGRGRGRGRGRGGYSQYGQRDRTDEYPTGSGYGGSGYGGFGGTSDFGTGGNGPTDGGGDWNQGGSTAWGDQTQHKQESGSNSAWNANHTDQTPQNDDQW